MGVFWWVSYRPCLFLATILSFPFLFPLLFSISPYLVSESFSQLFSLYPPTFLSLWSRLVYPLPLPPLSLLHSLLSLLSLYTPLSPSPFCLHPHPTFLLLLSIPISRLFSLLLHSLINPLLPFPLPFFLYQTPLSFPLFSFFTPSCPLPKPVLSITPFLSPPHRLLYLPPTFFPLPLRPPTSLFVGLCVSSP